MHDGIRPHAGEKVQNANNEDWQRCQGILFDALAQQEDMILRQTKLIRRLTDLLALAIAG